MAASIGYKKSEFEFSDCYNLFYNQVFVVAPFVCVGGWLQCGYWCPFLFSNHPAGNNRALLLYFN